MDNALNETRFRPTVEIHVCGQDLRGLERVRCDLESGAIRQMMTEKYDNC